MLKRSIWANIHLEEAKIVFFVWSKVSKLEAKTIDCFRRLYFHICLQIKNNKTCNPFLISNLKYKPMTSKHFYANGGRLNTRELTFEGAYIWQVVFCYHVYKSIITSSKCRFHRHIRYIASVSIGIRSMTSLR